MKILLGIYFTLCYISPIFADSNFNLHLETLADRIDLSKPPNVTWSTVSTIIKSITDKLINPNMYGLHQLNKKLKILSFDCYESYSEMVKGIRNEKKWAIEMIDASAKLPSGILEGTVMDFGAFDECLKIRKMYKQEEEFRGQYCMVGFHSPMLSPLTQKAPDGRDYVKAYGQPPEWGYEVLDRAGGYMKRIALWFGVCVPSTCSKEDIRKLAQVVSSPLGFNVSISDCQIDKPYEWPSYSIAAVSVLGCIAGLCIIGTFIDVLQRNLNSTPTSGEDEHAILRAFKAFSVVRNSEALLFCGSGGCLSCFGGIRFMSATWIVLGHCYFYTDQWKYLKYRNLVGFTDQFNGYLPAAVLENFTVPVGSFFYMSGFLLVFTTWKRLENNEGRMNLFMFFVHKYWRMTPALGLTLALFLAMPVVDSGPIWNSTLKQPLKQCLNFWWGNLLYINNWWNTDEYCLIHTWYLAALMQFHLVGIVLLLLTYRFPMVGALFASALSIACVAVTTLLIVQHDYPMPAPGMVKDMDIIEDYTSQIYIKPFAHFTTYLIGMVTAYIVLRYPNKLQTRYQLLGWTLAVSGALASVYGLYAPAPNPGVRVLYIIGHRLGWALSIGWMVYNCSTKAGGVVNRFLSWSALAPLGHLSYLTYLLHPLVIIYRNASLRERIYNGHTEIVFSFLSTLFVSFFLAYIGYVAVEAPFAVLEKIVFKRQPICFFKTTLRKVAISEEKETI